MTSKRFFLVVIKTLLHTVRWITLSIDKSGIFESCFSLFKAIGADFTTKISQE